MRLIVNNIASTCAKFVAAPNTIRFSNPDRAFLI